MGYTGDPTLDNSNESWRVVEFLTGKFPQGLAVNLISFTRKINVRMVRIKTGCRLVSALYTPSATNLNCSQSLGEIRLKLQAVLVSSRSLQLRPLGHPQGQNSGIDQKCVYITRTPNGTKQLSEPLTSFMQVRHCLKVGRLTALCMAQTLASSLNIGGNNRG